MSDYGLLTKKFLQVGLAIVLVATGHLVAGAAGPVYAEQPPVGSPIGPHVTVLQSCLSVDPPPDGEAADMRDKEVEGHIDVLMVNVQRDRARYDVEINHPEALPRALSRTRQIASLEYDKASFVVPGDAEQNYNVTVRRNGMEIHNQPVNPRCQQLAAPEAPEASVVNTCSGGDGSVRVFYVNQSRGGRRWSATLTSLTDPNQRVGRQEGDVLARERDAAVFPRRSDGVYHLEVHRENRLVRSFYVEVDCDNPEWNTQPEQLRVLEIAFVPPTAADPSLVDQRTSFAFRGNQTVEELSRSINTRTDRVAEMLELGSQSNNGFAVPGIDLTFVDRVEIRERPPVDNKLWLKRVAEEINPGDPRVDPRHPSAFDRSRLLCNNEVIPTEYFYKPRDETNRVPVGQCVYLSEVSRPNYPEILESRLPALPRSQFSGSGRSFCDYVEDEQIDQVWIWTDHGMEVEPAEAIMSSRRGVSFNVANEDVMLREHRLYPQCDKTYSGFNMNYTREASVHIFIHAIEGLMSWNPAKYSEADRSMFSWATASNRRLDNTFGAECGDAHWAPNVPRRPGQNFHWTEYLVTITNAAWSECFGWNPASVNPWVTPNLLVHSADSKTATRTLVSCETWNGCHPGGVANPLVDGPQLGNTEELVQNYEVWWLKQLPGLGFEHLAQFDGALYRVNSPWSILADPDRFIPDGASNRSHRFSSFMLADYPRT